LGTSICLVGMYGLGMLRRIFLTEMILDQTCTIDTSAWSMSAVLATLSIGVTQTQGPGTPSRSTCPRWVAARLILRADTVLSGHRKSQTTSYDRHERLEYERRTCNTEHWGHADAGSWYRPCGLGTHQSDIRSDEDEHVPSPLSARPHGLLSETPIPHKPKKRRRPALKIFYSVLYQFTFYFFIILIGSLLIGSAYAVRPSARPVVRDHRPIRSITSR
jgi:hypothetical protein